MGKLNKIFKISSTDFATLKETGQITKAGVTYKYDPDNLYLIENNLTDDYVLLGAGGSKLESELSVKHADTADVANDATHADRAGLANYSNGVYNRPETYNTDNPVWHSTSGDSTTGMYRTLHFDSSFTYNPSTDTLKVPHLEGTATEAKKVINKLTVGTKTYDGSTAVSLTKADLGLENVNNTADKDKQVYEANLQWGGKNLSGSYGPLDAALVSNLGANRLAFLPAECIDIEYSRDGGVTWNNYTATDTEKINLFVKRGIAYYIGGTSEKNIDKSTHQLRITIKNVRSHIYNEFKKFVLYVSTNGSTGCWCTIDGRLQSDVEANNDNWKIFINKQPVSGWSGYNVLNYPNGITTYGYSQGKTSQYGNVRFTFGCESHNQNYGGLNIMSIQGFGGEGWVTPSTLALTGHLYEISATKAATFPEKVYAKSFLEDNVALSSKYAPLSSVPESLTTTDIDDAIK